MRVLWFHNIMIPQIAKELAEKESPFGGWMVNLADRISNVGGVELTISFPYCRKVSGMVGKIKYRGFSLNPLDIRSDSLMNCGQLVDIITEVQYDIVHIFGTESRHCYAVTEICKEIGIDKKVVISIQGMLSVYHKHYYAYLDYSIVKKKTFHDWLRGGLKFDKETYIIGGCFEKAALCNISHIIGRTDWDRACSAMVNPGASYHYHGEMLRNTFYIGEKWKVAKCRRHSIFMSQAYSPVKGLHLALEALNILKKNYEDVLLKVAGNSYYDKPQYKRKAYEKHIIEFIRDNQLAQNVEFVGTLNEEEMKEMYLEANVFISASSIENSPNSVCEAMISGVPCVSSFVGGVGNLIEHGRDGYYYPADEPYMLAYYIKQIFEDDKIAQFFSLNAIKKAENRHCIKTIEADLLRTYHDIIKTVQ